MRFLLRTVALIAVFPYLGAVLLLATGTASWSSVAYVVAIGALLGGLVTLPDPRPRPQGTPRRGRPRGLSRGAVVALATIAIARAVVAGEGRHLRMPASAGPAGDRAEGAAREMRRDQGDAPSPVAATYLGLQEPDAFDLVLVSPGLISGADSSTPPAGIPTLVIHGRQDSMVSYESARVDAANAGARLVTLDAGHVAMLVKGEEADRAVREFVTARLDGARATR